MIIPPNQSPMLGLSATEAHIGYKKPLRKELAAMVDEVSSVGKQSAVDINKLSEQSGSRIVHCLEISQSRGSLSQLPGNLYDQLSGFRAQTDPRNDIPMTVGALSGTSETVHVDDGHMSVERRSDRGGSVGQQQVGHLLDQWRLPTVRLYPNEVGNR